MMRVLAQGMRELAFDPGDRVQDLGQARVDLRLKRELVQAAVQQGGLGCLPLLGRGLHQFTHEPTHHALASARSARDLFDRWQRLERYIHSRHRCVIESCDQNEAHIRHVALGQGNAPSAAEDLVVAGVLAALLEATGLQRVSLRVGSAKAYPDPDSHGIHVAAARGGTAQWHFRWESIAFSAPVPRSKQLPPELGADPAWPETVRATYLRLVEDLASPLGLRELADALGIASRTLQRRLGEHGLNYSRLLAEARCRTGAWRLLNTTDPIAEVGFLSGFSDQPHFTREMQRRVGVPPAAYREAFGLFGRQGSGIPSRAALR